MEEKKTVEMTAEEAQEFAAFRSQMEKKRKEEQRRQDIEAYNALVDDTLAGVFPALMGVSQAIGDAKRRTMESFRKAIEMKTDIYGIRTDQRSHTFTNSDGNRRVMIGFYTLDNYRDTVEEGIAMVREAIEALGKDEESRALVNAVFRLLSRDQKGTLKASRVLQLEKLAIDSRNERLIQGVQIIKESYQPQMSKQYVRAEYKNEEGVWMPVSLGMTEA